MILLAAELVRPGLHVGPAYPHDVAAIGGLLEQARGDCLPVEADELLERLGQFEVARAPSGQVVGCASVSDAGERAELRCVAVRPEWRGTGVGRLLVQRAVERARGDGAELFCVTRKPRFFESLGFSRLPTEAVPERLGAATDGPRRCALLLRQPTPSPAEARS